MGVVLFFKGEGYCPYFTKNTPFFFVALCMITIDSLMKTSLKFLEVLYRYFLLCSNLDFGLFGNSYNLFCLFLKDFLCAYEL